MPSVKALPKPTISLPTQRLITTSLLARHFFKSLIVLFFAQKAFVFSNFCSLINPFVGLRLGPNPKTLNPKAPLEWLINDISFLCKKIKKLQDN